MPLAVGAALISRPVICRVSSGVVKIGQAAGGDAVLLAREWIYINDGTEFVMPLIAIFVLLANCASQANPRSEPVPKLRRHDDA